MSDIINSIFGRPKTDVATSGEHVAAATAVQAYPTESGSPDLAVTRETGDTEAIEVEQAGTETVAPTDDVAEPTEAVTTDDAPADENAEAPADTVESDDADDQADDVEDKDDVEDEATSDAAAEDESDETTMDDESDYDESDEVSTDDEPTDVSNEDVEIAMDVAPVAVESDDVPVVAETETDDADQAEPVVEPAVAVARPAAGERGSTTVGDGVVAKIVNMVAGKTDGVYSLDNEGTSVEVGDDIATIRISLVVEYGHAIRALAERIRVDVIEAVEQFFGLDVAAVDIHVSDIHQPAAS